MMARVFAMRRTRRGLALVASVCGAALLGTPPVNVTRSMSGFVSISSAISRGSPVTTENISGGSPAS